ncbi:PREDICTED: uncharacterized protein LOC109228683 [Nicotiana attenuata]|uniref:DUF7815 domain-containing protein n=1 Tax=Nicotiana attenuata TaxID=49451 RepID=A0A1J6I507_NICAT|nr:PREDICTED: uncharacterized protein LOC109228683 [Nicotiana attenuata]OIT00118.1 hypothetical protein A4A49_34668 [Nicotiana attenuata]
MALELPNDLIQQAKISTRTEAGLPDYNPDDASLPAMPSLSASVAASPPYLRCKHCQGKLLRGLQSLICIYCGQKLHQNAEVAPDPISFKSTLGYQWFLQALRLDGSEKVGAATEKNQVNKGPSSPHDEILLSDLLDLKIRWPTELETDNTITNKKLEQSKSSYSSTGVDLDNFLSFTNISSAYREQADISDNIGAAVNKTDGSHEDLSLFENLRSSEPAVTSATVQTTDDRSSERAVTSSTVETTNDFSGWKADFQSADSGEENVSNKSSTPIGSAGQHVFTSFGTSMSSTVSSGNQQECSKSADTFVGSDIDLSAQLDTVFGTPKGPIDGKLMDVAAVSPAANDWPAVDLWDNANSGTSQNAEEVLPIVRPKDAELQDSSNDPSTSIDWFQDDTWQTQNAPASKHDAANGDHDSFDEWNTFTSSAPIKDPFKDAPAPKHDAANGDDDSFDEWNTFTSSAPIKDPFENAPAPKHDTANGDDDSFDEWNTFTSSVPTKDPFENVLVQRDNDNNNNNAELTNFSSNLEDMDFGSFSQSDPFSGAPGKEGVSAEVNDNILEVPTIFSAVDTPNKVGDNAEHASENADIIGESISSKNDMDIEGIMSQMHDLSFMLETNLSIPSKSSISLPRD